jgi:hypothetical protein
MTSDRDTTVRVRSWLRTDTNDDASRLLGIVMGQLDDARGPHARRRRPAGFGRSRGFGYAIAAAVVLLVIAAAIELGNPRTAQPQPTPSVHPAEGPTAIGPAADGESLGGGRYVVELGLPRPVEPYRLELTLPNGWTPRTVTRADTGFSSPWEDSFFMVVRVAAVYKDPCHPELGYATSPALGAPNRSTIQQALTSLPGFEHDPITTVRVGNQPATEFVLRNRIDAEAAGCTDGSDLPIAVTGNADIESELEIRREAVLTVAGSTSNEAVRVVIIGRSDLPLVIFIFPGDRSGEKAAAIDAILASMSY